MDNFNPIYYTNKQTSPIAIDAIHNSEIKGQSIQRVEVEWVDFGVQGEAITHEDIPMFSFAPLKEIENDFLSNRYSKKEVKSMISGLSELPEYAKSNRSKKSRT